MSQSEIAIFWYRRDLRLFDNAGLYHALRSGLQVLPLFIFDTNILEKLSDGTDPRVSFIYQNLLSLKQELQKMGSDIIIKLGTPMEVWEQLVAEYTISAVYTNHDYENYALHRDGQIAALLNQTNVPFRTYKDQVIFEKKEVLSGQETPYTVFTPYSRKWKEQCNAFYVSAYPNEKYFDRFLKTDPIEIPTLGAIGFQEHKNLFPSKTVSDSLLSSYDELRNFPSLPATSRLGVHLRFGTVSIRELAQRALRTSNTWLNELIWRDFYHQIIANFPHIGEGKAFRPVYDLINWRNNETEFKAWCEGKTGYPLVDAGMRELNQTGFMHNRVRMVTASFLTKHLLIDWRWGEAYFAEKLLDFDFAANNGGWQWAAGSGTDAAPYFRVFNPTAQAAKFDPQGEYIKKWIPELNSLEYPLPIVDHKLARERCLKVYKIALNNNP
tara:strand:- start:752 stop:2068 length:1317 start_codon:yes stop_codon:yes gene_type:complete